MGTVGAAPVGVQGLVWTLRSEWHSRHAPRRGGCCCFRHHFPSWGPLCGHSRCLTAHAVGGQRNRSTGTSSG